MMADNVKNIIRPVWRRFYGKYEKARVNFKSMNLPIAKLLRGGENGIRAAKYAEISNDFLRPSTPVTQGPHVQLLRQYDEIGDKLFEDEIFQQTAYYKNAAECIRLTGSYFYDRTEKIQQLAQRFIAQYQGKNFDMTPQPGQSAKGAPIWVRPIKSSSYYEVIDGNHRIARAIMRGEEYIQAYVYEPQAVYTPLQQLLLDSLWINKQKWLYQPIEAPELKDEWILVRQCTDRLEKMKRFLDNQGLLSDVKQPLSYLDIASSYGWFVKEFSKLNFQAHGMERDPAAIDVGVQVYGLKRAQITHSDIVVGLEALVKNQQKFDVVSLLSILHHFALNKSSTSAETLIDLVDRVTGKVLFLDTGEEHEIAFGDTLAGWNVENIKKWLLKHTSFKQVIALGIDDDKRKPFEGYYHRMLFACIR